MILNYHRIDADHVPDPYTVTCGQLDEQLHLVAQLRRVDGAGESEWRVTFDDGHVSSIRYGVPLLEKHRLSAAFFVLVGSIEHQAHAMSWADLHALLAAGHSIGSHTCSHPLLTSCTDSRLRDELERSKRTLEDRLGVRVEAISIPFGRWDARVLQACASVGYKRVYTSDPWMSPRARSGIECYGRLTVRASMDILHVRRLLTAEGSSTLLLRAPYFMKQTLRGVVGDRMYHRIQRRFAPPDEP